MAKFNNEKPQLLLHQPNSYPVGICYMMQGAQTGALGQPSGIGQSGRREGGSRGRGHMYTHG